MTEKPRIAFLGLGRMGTEMVAVLAENGLRPTVWNRSAEKAIGLAKEFGLEAAGSPAEAVRDADVVVTMLTDGQAVLATLEGEDGIIAGASEGAVLIDCSTTGAHAAKEAAERCAAAGVRFVDCPVSGSTVVARQGKLGLMAGGDAAVVERIRPVLDVLGTVVHVGPTGAGAAAKVAVNALLHTFSTATAECVVTARAAGVPPERLFDVLEVGVLWNRFLDYKRGAFVDPEHAPVAFDLRTATKDLGLAVRAEERAGLSASVVRCALELHRRALEDGLGDRDMAAMVGWFADTAGEPGNSAADGEPPSAQTERN